MCNHCGHRVPTIDPLIFAIEQGDVVGADALEVAIVYRHSLIDQRREELDQLHEETRTLERAHARILALEEV